MLCYESCLLNMSVNNSKMIIVSNEWIPHVSQWRRCFIFSEALQIMSVGYSSKVLQFRLTDLSRVLGFDSEDEAGRACQERGLGITKDGVVFQRAIHKVDKVCKLFHRLDIMNQGQKQL